MKEWSPISKEDLNSEISEAVSRMSLEAKSIWRLIKFSSPTKWKQEFWGEKGQGFWVVATFSNHCIYFNDIENGFNISKFEKLGIINDYWCNQDELNQVLERLADPDFTP